MSEHAEFQLSARWQQEVDAWLKKFPESRKQSALLYALRILQEEEGYLSEAGMKVVADYLGLPHINAFEVASFYSMYDLAPRGKHKIGVCVSISCMLCGSAKILAYLEQRLQIKVGETTADGRFTLQRVECLAACAGAPALIVNDKHYHEALTPESIDAVLAALD
jgi:NADH-quinone oxidoreductase subunit E